MAEVKEFDQDQYPRPPDYCSGCGYRAEKLAAGDRCNVCGYSKAAAPPVELEPWRPNDGYAGYQVFNPYIEWQARRIAELNASELRWIEISASQQKHLREARLLVEGLRETVKTHAESIAARDEVIAGYEAERQKETGE